MLSSHLWLVLQCRRKTSPSSHKALLDRAACESENRQPNQDRLPGGGGRRQQRRGSGKVSGWHCSLSSGREKPGLGMGVGYWLWKQCRTRHLFGQSLISGCVLAGSHTWEGGHRNARGITPGGTQPGSPASSGARRTLGVVVWHPSELDRDRSVDWA